MAFHGLIQPAVASIWDIEKTLKSPLVDGGNRQGKKVPFYTSLSCKHLIKFFFLLAFHEVSEKYYSFLCDMCKAPF